MYHTSAQKDSPSTSLLSKSHGVLRPQATRHVVDRQSDVVFHSRVFINIEVAQWVPIEPGNWIFDRNLEHKHTQKVSSGWNLCSLGNWSVISIYSNQLYDFGMMEPLAGAGKCWCQMSGKKLQEVRMSYCTCSVSLHLTCLAVYSWKIIERPPTHCCQTCPISSKRLLRPVCPTVAAKPLVDLPGFLLLGLSIHRSCDILFFSTLEGKHRTRSTKAFNNWAFHV